MAWAEDWPGWRGPHRNGVVAEPSGWQGGDWPAGGLLWQGQVGMGASSPLVVGKQVLVLGWNEGADTLSALDAATGEALWRQTYPSPQYGRHAVGDEGLYAGPTSTPEYDAQTGYVYTLSVDGELRCWNSRRRGRLVWRRNLYEAYGMPQRPQIGRSGQRDYGYTTSPLVHGDWLIVEVGGSEGTLMAFDKRTGDARWGSACRDPAGHTGGPVPITVEGIPCMCVLSLFHLVVVRLDAGHEGQTLAEYEWFTDFANSIATPAVEGSDVLVTSGYNHETICRLHITPQGVEKVWEAPYHSKICSPVIYQGHVYWAWRSVYCLDFATGGLRWQGGAFGDAGSCVLTADERLIVLADRGELYLLETHVRSPDQYTELARLAAMFDNDAWPHVVLSGGRLYCKDRMGHLMVYSVMPP
ncbi:MAG: PQQ-binding-like beta-propeller repeat protein [Pirellulales bacterium]|nr:PQQ-binding-like beta-propeller repeat protein [Pirellulales bacterium]